jgi:hypothetical protein
MLSFNINSKGRKMKYQIKKPLVIMVLNLFVLTSAAYAQRSKYVKEGTYIGINLIENQMFGDFDGFPRVHDFFYTEVFDIPYVDDGKGFGVVLGSRGPKGAFELGYQRTRHDTSSFVTVNGMPFGESEATYSVIDFNFKIDVFARNQTRPYLLFGFGFPWLTVEDGSYDGSFQDETFSGFAFNAGTGLAYYIRPQLAVTGGLIYRWNWFTWVEYSSLDDILLEKAFCFNIGIAYTF